MRAGDFRNPLRLEPTDLAALLREVAAQVVPFVTARGLRFEVDVADDLGDVRDRRRQDPRRGAEPAHQRHQVHARRRRDPPVGPARSSDGRGARSRWPTAGSGWSPARSRQLFEPFFTEFDPSRHSSGDFGFQQAGAGARPEPGQAVRRAARRDRRGRERAGRGTQITIILPRSPGLARGYDTKPWPRRPSRRRPRARLPLRPPPRESPDADCPDRRGRARGQPAPGP